MRSENMIKTRLSCCKIATIVAPLSEIVVAAQSTQLWR